MNKVLWIGRKMAVIDKLLRQKAVAVDWAGRRVCTRRRIGPAGRL